MVKNQDKEKAYIMAQGPSAITSLGKKISWKVVCTQLELGMVVIEMFTY